MYKLVILKSVKLIDDYSFAYASINFIEWLENVAEITEKAFFYAEIG